MPVGVPLSALIRWKIRWIVAAASVAALGILAAPASAAASAAPAIHDPALARIVAHRPASQVVVIAQFRPGVSPAQAQRLVRRVTGRPSAVVPIIHAVAARMTARQAARLARHPQVRAVSLNSRVHGQGKAKPAPVTYPNPLNLATSFVQSTNTDQLWPQATGKGVGVAVIDSGIAGDLPDFRTSASDPTSRIVAAVTVNPYATNQGDPQGHGTHVAGLIAGNSSWRAAGDPDQGRFVGAAPDANLISIKAGDDNGNATVLDVIYGLAFVVTHKDLYNIKVVNLSLESSSAESYNTDPLDAVVEGVWFSGITVVAAVGNRGTDSDAVDYAPGNDPYVISVGGVNDEGTKSDTDDIVASWSSRGTTQDGFAKPDLYAPGTRILSTLAPASAFASMCPACVVDGAYIRASGSSMAAPIVSGIVADLVQLHPTWTPNQLKGALLSTRRDVANGEAKEIDAYAASRASSKQLVSNQNQTPSKLLTDMIQAIQNGTTVTSSSGATLVEGTRSSWSRSSWSLASGDLSADWARSSWSCDCSRTDSGDIDPQRSSWSRSSWSTILGR